MCVSNKLELLFEKKISEVGKYFSVQEEMVHRCDLSHTTNSDYFQVKCLLLIPNNGLQVLVTSQEAE